jgi:ankyrin repeat protein
LKAQSDVTLKNSSGTTAFREEADNDHLKIVNALLKAGTNAHVQITTLNQL